MTYERIIDNLHLSKEEICTLIAPAFGKRASIDDFHLLQGGALNTIYTFSIRNERYVLRIYLRDRALCQKEYEIYTLIKRKVLCPEVIYSDSNYSPYAYSIIKYIDGSDLVGYQEKCSYELGKILAHIHSFRFPQAGLLDERLHISTLFPEGSSPYLEHTIKILLKDSYSRRHLGDAFADQIVCFLSKNERFFPRVTHGAHLIHSDFKPCNLRISHDGQMYVLDWEFAHSGLVELDFACLLRHLDQFALDCTELKQGYIDHGGTLSEEWIRSSFLVDFINIITLMDYPQARKNLFATLRSKLVDTINQFDEIRSV